MKKPKSLNLSGHRTLGEDLMSRVRAGNNASATVAIAGGPTTGASSFQVNLGSVRVGLG